MKNLRRIFNLGFFLIMTAPIVFADVVVPNHFDKEYHEPEPSFFQKSNVLAILVFLVSFACVFIAIKSCIDKAKNNEEKFKKIIKTIEETIFLISSVFFGLLIFIVALPMSAIRIIYSVFMLIITICAFILRYKYREIKGSNLVLYCLNALVYTCSILHFIN